MSLPLSARKSIRQDRVGREVGEIPVLRSDGRIFMLLLMLVLLVVMLRFMFLVMLFVLPVLIAFIVVESPHRVCMPEENFSAPLKLLTGLAVADAIQSTTFPPEILVVHPVDLRATSVTISPPGTGNTSRVQSPARSGEGELIVCCRGPSAQKSAIGFKFRLVFMCTASVVVAMVMVVQMRDASKRYGQSILPTRRQ